MPLVSVTDILFQSDEFWANSTLDSLRMLVKTSKGFKVTLQGEGKKKKDTPLPSLTVQAITVMMERRPTANGEWMLKFVHAKHWFMLRLDTMINFCTSLPAESSFHLSETDTEWVRKGGTAFICFMDAYKLTLNTGLKAAMERRAHSDQKLMDSAFESLDFHRPSDTMRKNIRAAIRVLKADEQTAKVKRGLRLLDKLDLDVCMTHGEVTVIKYSLEKRQRDVEYLKKCIADYKKARQTLTKRYKAHSVYCPEKMPTEFLDD
jgi:hypothetical protein